MTEREYRANIEGMNIVFGAVLGFVLAGRERMGTEQFASLLFLSATVVVTILYLGSSEYTLFYGVTAIIAVAALPQLLAMMDIPPIRPLQPTLAVWLGFVILLEFLPKVSNGSTDDKESAEKP